MLLFGVLEGEVPLAVRGLTPHRVPEIHRNLHVFGGDVRVEGLVFQRGVQFERGAEIGPVLGKRDGFGVTFQILEKVNRQGIAS